MTWIYDAMVIGGVAASVYGVSLIHAPAAWIVGGVITAVIGLLAYGRRVPR